MLWALLCLIISLKVYKKHTPNGKVAVYLGKRDFLDRCDGTIDPIEGVVTVEKDYLKGRKVFGQLLTTYRYGREEDEVMGVKFSKTLPLQNAQIIPPEDEKLPIAKLQQKLLDKLGGNAYPFTFKFPSNAPASVVIQSGLDDKSKPLGIEHRVLAFVGDNIEDVSHKRSTVSLIIKKLSFAPIERLDRLPSAMASKSFTFSHGKVNMEITLNKEVYYHGEDIIATLVVTNNSRKTVKSLRVSVVQHVELTMTNMQLTNSVANVETREGCPITPNHSFSKQFQLTPLASSNKEKRGIALDGYLKDGDVNLASSTISPSGKIAPEPIGILVKYSVQGKINFGTLGGDLTVDVPLKLVHQELINVSIKTAKLKEKSGLTRVKSIDRAHYEEACYAQDDEEHIEFEDFARHRLSEIEE